MDIRQVKIFPLAIAKIIKHSASYPNTEIAGFLIGRFQRDMTIITDIRTGRQKGNTVHVVIDDIELARVAEEIESHESDEKIVGWYHSHPNMGAHFFSRTDISTQNRYQMFSPQTVGFVVDPSKFIQTGDPTQIDLKCWRVQNNNSVRIDYEIVVDTVACFQNVLDHIRYEAGMDNELPIIISNLIPQLQDPYNYQEIRTKTHEVVEKGGLGVEKTDSFLRISVQTLILSTFVFFTLLFITMI